MYIPLRAAEFEYFTGISLYDAGVSLLDGLWSGLKSMWDKVAGWFDGIVGKIKGIWDGIAGIFGGANEEAKKAESVWRDMENKRLTQENDMFMQGMELNRSLAMGGTPGGIPLGPPAGAREMIQKQAERQQEALQGKVEVVFRNAPESVAVNPRDGVKTRVERDILSSMFNGPRMVTG